jgi:RNA polymerase sigma-70 factor, ECF subfamily
LVRISALPADILGCDKEVPVLTETLPMNPSAALAAAEVDDELVMDVEETGAEAEEAKPSASALLGHTKETEALFAQLYEQYEQAIYAYVYRLLGDSEDAMDFAQDAFVKAYKKLPETLAKGNFQGQAWLYRIATNVCLDELRHRKLIKWQAWESFVSLFHPSQVARDNPERDALQSETKHEVEKVLEKLSERYRVALVLREYHGLGYEEIAEIMGTTRTAVKTLLLRARESFRLHYAKLHPTLAAEAKGPRVLPRIMGRPVGAAAYA